MKESRRMEAGNLVFMERLLHNSGKLAIQAALIAELLAIARRS
jgi:hypothetical protein